MPHMFIVVKGNRQQAENEARRRNIEFSFDAESFNGNETYGYAPMIERPKIIGWYCEDQGIAKIPSIGSCLWYAERND